MKLQLLIGMIASSKSTYCKAAARHCYLIINDDAIVNMLHADQYTFYDKELKPLYKNIENHIIGQAVLAEKNVIIDRGLNISKAARQRYIALARSFDITCEAVVFKKEQPEVHAKRRYEHDNRGHDYEYWLKVAERHAAIWDDPTLEEGLDRIYYLSYNDVKQGVVI